MQQKPKIKKGWLSREEPTMAGMDGNKHAALEESHLQSITSGAARVTRDAQRASASAVRVVHKDHEEVHVESTASRHNPWLRPPWLRWGPGRRC
jgi:hypothetical protein